MNEVWGWASIAAVSSIAVAAWGQIRGVWGKLANIVVVTTRVDWPLELSLRIYCRDCLYESRFYPRTYGASDMFLRNSQWTRLIGYEDTGVHGLLFWKGLRPLWLGRGVAANGSPDMYSVSFIRGTWDIEQLLLDVLAYRHTIAEEALASTPASLGRFRVVRVAGTARRRSSMLGQQGSGPPDNNKGPMAMSSGSVGSGHPGASVSTQFRGIRLLGCTRDELGPPTGGHVTLTMLALSEDIGEALAEVARWLKSGKWYYEHNIPWRFGWMLHGAPGTGKTATLRAIAQHFDLPIYLFDLATMDNNELVERWTGLQDVFPRMVVFEDIDAVFRGRENVADTDLTFDCILNCIDGVSSADGVFLAITTNKPETLDPALGVDNGAGICSRPGRIDRILEFGSPNREGRYKICQRILGDWPHTHDATVLAGDGETGAQFQDRCVRLALELYWQKQPESCIGNNTTSERGGITNEDVRAA